MPRRGRSPSPSRAAPRPVSRVPARAPQHNQPAPVPHSPAPMAAAPQQPGMFAQMATTAAGVAVGSAVGHTLGHAMTGAFSGGGSEVAPASQPAEFQPQGQPQAQTSPCQFEFKQFLECTQTQNDISLCQGFNEVLRQCKEANGNRYNLMGKVLRLKECLTALLFMSMTVSYYWSDDATIEKASMILELEKGKKKVCFLFKQLEKE